MIEIIEVGYPQTLIEVNNESYLIKTEDLFSDKYIVMLFESTCIPSLSPDGMDAFDKVKEDLFLARPHLK